MLDKDFDAHFKSSFEGYEIAPATDSWTKISEKINPKPKRKGFPVFWMAAASVIIVLGIGIGLYTKPTEVIKLHPDGDSEMMANLAQEQKAPIKVVEAPETIAKPSKKPALRTVANKPLTKESVAVEKVLVDETTLINEPVEMELASVKNAKSVRPKLVTEHLLEQEEISNLKKVDAVTLTKTNDSVTENTVFASAFSTKKLKISSVGDLVNFVVAKVDKRDDKLIKISKTDESDNEIIGINLGLIKFNKRD